MKFAALPLAAASPAEDAPLLRLVDELVTIVAEQDRLIATMTAAAACEDPAYAALEVRLFEVIDEIAAAEAMTTHGLQAKARVLQAGPVVESYEWTCDIAASLAADILRVFPVGGVG